VDDSYADPYKDLTPEERERYGIARRIALAHLGSERHPAAWFRQACADEDVPMYGLVADIMDAEVAAREARGRFQVLPGERHLPSPWQRG